MGTKVDYGQYDPKGWGGDPSRGAALGRSTIVDGVPAGFSGRIHVQRIRLDAGGYDRNGTYFGYDLPLWWVAFDDGETTIDYMIRASDRTGAKAQVLQKFPGAKFYR